MYEEIVSSIYSLVGASTFSLEMVPRDFYGVINPKNDEFFAIQILTPSADLLYNAKVITGYVYIDIFTKIGEGDVKAAKLLDELDSVFQGKTLPNGLQFFQSQSQNLGRDQDNPSLKRIEYQIPFKLYGEL
jgi:hypothetical protein